MVEHCGYKQDINAGKTNRADPGRVAAVFSSVIDFQVKGNAIYGNRKRIAYGGFYIF
jgi:hypothetical protein